MRPCAYRVALQYRISFGRAVAESMAGCKRLVAGDSAQGSSIIFRAKSIKVWLTIARFLARERERQGCHVGRQR